MSQSCARYKRGGMRAAVHRDKLLSNWTGGGARVSSECASRVSVVKHIPGARGDRSFFLSIPQVARSPSRQSVPVAVLIVVTPTCIAWHACAMRVVQVARSGYGLEPPRAWRMNGWRGGASCRCRTEAATVSTAAPGSGTRMGRCGAATAAHSASGLRYFEAGRIDNLCE